MTLHGYGHILWEHTLLLDRNFVVSQPTVSARRVNLERLAQMERFQIAKGYFGICPRDSLIISI